MKKILLIAFMSSFLFNPFVSESKTLPTSSLRYLSFRNPYVNLIVENCPVEIRVEYDFTLVYNNGERFNQCGIQETIMPYSSASVDLRRGSPADNFEANFILNNAVIYVTIAGFTYQFIYNETGQIECGGNCWGTGPNYCVILSIEGQSSESISYSLWYGFPKGESQK